MVGCALDILPSYPHLLSSLTMVRGAFRKLGAVSSPTHTTQTPRTPQTLGTFIHLDNYDRGRRPYGLSNLIQSLPGQLYMPEGLFVQPTPISSTPVASANVEEESEEDMDVDDENVEPGVAYEKQQQKKERQWQKWSKVTIPAMLKPYLELLRVTNSLRDLDHVRSNQGCTGCDQGQMLEVSCIYFDSM